MYIHYFSHQRLNNYCSNREKEKYVKKGLHGLFHNTEKKKDFGVDPRWFVYDSNLNVKYSLDDV